MKTTKRDTLSLRRKRMGRSVPRPKPTGHVPANPPVLAEQELNEERGVPEALIQYLNQIGRVPLVSPKEEVALAKRIKHGDRAARDILIKANLRLVVKIARDYEGMGVPLIDLIGEGNIGLMKGVNRFKPNKGAKFSTYGSWWIKQAIKRALWKQSKSIRVPVHVIDRMRYIRDFSHDFEADLKRPPTPEEIADGLDLTMTQVLQAQRAIDASPISLDAPIAGNESESYVGDTIADESLVHPAGVCDTKTKLAHLRVFLSKLPPRELEVIERRFGLNGYEREHTLKEVGDKFGVVRELIRQIQNLARTRLYRMFEEVGITSED